MNELILLEDLGTLYPTLNSKHKARYGLYKCFCGVEFKTLITSVKNGKTKSCGCYQKLRAKECSGTHNLRNIGFIKLGLECYIDVIIQKWQDIKTMVAGVLRFVKDG